MHSVFYKLSTPILKNYTSKDLYHQKKATYTMMFLLLIALYSLVVTLISILSYGVVTRHMIELSSWILMIPLMLYLIYRKQLTIAINLLILVGFLKGLDVINTPLGLHAFIHLALFALTVAAIHIHKYQLYFGLISSYSLMIYHAISYTNHTIYSTNDLLVNYTISILLGFLMYLITVNYISNIVDHEIEKTLKLDYLVRTDVLTGLSNRYAFNQYVNELNPTHNYYIMILDLDHFKKVNDTLGHSTGDQVLVQFSHLLKTNLRSTDQIFRIGGEEFFIIIDNITPGNGLKIANSLRNTVSTSDFSITFPLTVSIGTAYIKAPFDKNMFDTFFVQADHALYDAKESGRNKVIEA